MYIIYYICLYIDIYPFLPRNFVLNLLWCKSRAMSPLPGCQAILKLKIKQNFSFFLSHFQNIAKKIREVKGHAPERSKEI